MASSSVFRSAQSLLLYSALGAAILASSISAREHHHRHRHAERDPHGGCGRCPPEWGVAKYCAESNEGPVPRTLCRPCPPGTWTPSHPHLMRCRPCSKCGGGLYVHRFCHPTADTECGVCAEPHRDGLTADFLKRCGPRPVPGAQDDPVNKLWEERRRNADPSSALPPVSDQRHRLWRLADLKESADGALTPEVLLKPSFHDYALAERAGPGQRRKTWLLLGLSATLLLAASLLASLLCLRRLRSHTPLHCPFRWPSQRLYVQLSDQDSRIVQECARHLDAKDRRRQGPKRDAAQWEPPQSMGHGTENPLAQLLPDLDALEDQGPVSYARTHKAARKP